MSDDTKQTQEVKAKVIYESDREDIARKKDREIAERMIKKGEMTLEEIADYIPTLSLDELKEIETEIMQLA